MLNKKNIIKKLVAILVIYILGRIMLEQEIIASYRIYYIYYWDKYNFGVA